MAHAGNVNVHLIGIGLPLVGERQRGLIRLYVYKVKSELVRPWWNGYDAEVEFKTTLSIYPTMSAQQYFRDSSYDFANGFSQATGRTDGL